MNYVMHICRNKKCNNGGIDKDLTHATVNPPDWKYCKDCAKERGIEVIPEIDMPGHNLALLSAFPEYSCKGESVTPAKARGVYRTILCAGQQRTLDFIEELLEEMGENLDKSYFDIIFEDVRVYLKDATDEIEAELQERYLVDNIRCFFDVYNIMNNYNKYIHFFLTF